MKIKLNINIFLFIILFFITNQIEVYSLIMIFALIHELSHLICGVILKFEPDILHIRPLGFSIEFKTKIEDYNKKIGKSNILSIKKILISLAGPLSNFIIIIVGQILRIDNNIIYSNVLILIFNLIPIYPLDGGRVLKNLLKIVCGNRKALFITNVVSNVLMVLITMISSIFILISKNIAIPLLIIILWGITIKENKRFNMYNNIYKVIDKSYNYL